MTLVTDATFSLSSKSMPSSITWSAQRIRLARLWYTRLWHEDSAELLKRHENGVEVMVGGEGNIGRGGSQEDLREEKRKEEEKEMK